jgi:hypothetical protein
LGVRICFAYQSFIWKNNAANNAGVACVIIGLSKKRTKGVLYIEGFRKEASNINAYLADAPNIFIDRTQNPISDIAPMTTGNVAYDGGNLIISGTERARYLERVPAVEKVIRPLTGSNRD